MCHAIDGNLHGGRVGYVVAHKSTRIRGYWLPQPNPRENHISLSSPLAFVKRAHRRHPRVPAPPMITIATKPLSSLPASVDAVSHPTQAPPRPQRWILYGSGILVSP